VPRDSSSGRNARKRRKKILRMSTRTKTKQSKLRVEAGAKKRGIKIFRNTKKTAMEKKGTWAFGGVVLWVGWLVVLWVGWSLVVCYRVFGTVGAGGTEEASSTVFTHQKGGEESLPKWETFLQITQEQRTNTGVPMPQGKKKGLQGGRCFLWTQKKSRAVARILDDATPGKKPAPQLTDGEIPCEKGIGKILLT